MRRQNESATIVGTLKANQNRANMLKAGINAHPATRGATNGNATN